LADQAGVVCVLRIAGINNAVYLAQESALSIIAHTILSTGIFTKWRPLHGRPSQRIARRIAQQARIVWCQLPSAPKFTVNKTIFSSANGIGVSLRHTYSRQRLAVEASLTDSHAPSKDILLRIAPEALIIRRKLPLMHDLGFALGVTQSWVTIALIAQAIRQ
jgi:hypothetical protein